MSPYCCGDVVELVESARARVALEPGRRGRIHRIDPNGVLWVQWTNGPLLPMIPSVDVVASANEA